MLCLFALGLAVLCPLLCSPVNDQRSCGTREISLYETIFLQALRFTLLHALMSLLERKQPIPIRNPGDYGLHTAVDLSAWAQGSCLHESCCRMKSKAGQCERNGKGPQGGVV